MIGNKMSKVSTPLNNPMAIATQALVKGQVISAEIAKLVTDGFKKTLAVGVTKKQTVDLMVAQKIKSFDISIKAPSPELRNSIKKAIVLGFNDSDQALLAKETKSLSDADKKEKRRLGMQVGSEIGYYERALKDREAKSTVTEVAEKSTPVQMYFKDLESALERLGKLENLPFDLVKHTSAIKKLLADK
jgi:hypothetical protein